jgi:hypothetical protein
MPSMIAWIWDESVIPQGYRKGNWDEGNTNGSPDTMTAGYAAGMMTTLYEQGWQFYRQDILRMANTLTAVTWNQSTTTPAFANYINGGNTSFNFFLRVGRAQRCHTQLGVGQIGKLFAAREKPIMDSSYKRSKNK